MNKTIGVRMNRVPVLWPLMLLLAVAMSGCGSTGKSVLADHKEAPTANPAMMDSSPNSKENLGLLRIPAETLLRVRLLQTISSRTASPGDEFDAELSSRLKTGERIAFPKSTRLRGRVVRAKASGRLHQPGRLSLTLNAIQDLNGKWLRISTTSVSARGKGHGRRNLTLIGGGTGVGALIGGLAGGGKGAALGAASGAAAGTAGAYATGKKDVLFAAERRLTFKTLQEFAVNR